MKKLIKWLFGTILVMALVLVAAVILLPRFFDPNEHKTEIEQLISQQVGRPVSLAGPIEWQVFPWLALSFHDVTIANAPGFSGDHLARAETLSARVKIMPLLKKQIRVGTVAARSADINLQVARDGRSNWQGIVDALASDTGAQDNTSAGAGPNIRISGIEITDAAIHYHDQAAAIRAELQETNLSTSRIEAGQPVDVRLDTTVALPDYGFSGALEGRILLAHVLDSADMTADIKKLTLDGQLKNGTSLIPVNLSLTQPAHLDFGQSRLDFPDIRLQLANAEVRATAQGHWSGAGNYAGTIQTKDINLRDFLSTTGGAPLAFANAEAMSRFSVQTPWRLQGSRLQLSDIQAQLDKTRLSGKLDFSDINQLSGQFELTMDTLNADDYFPVDNPESASHEATTTNTASGALNFGHLNGQMTINTLQVAGARFENTRLKIVTNGGRLRITPMRADFYQGLLNTQVLVDANAPRNKVTLESRAENIQVGPLLADVAGDQWLTGLGELTLNVAIDDPFAPKPLKTAHGTVAYELNDGAFYGVDILATIKQALDTLQQLRATNKTGDAPAAGVSGTDKKTEFAQIRFIGDINQGILASRELALITPFLTVGGQIRIDLDAMTIDGSIAPTLTHLPDDWVDPKYRQLLNVPIPVRLSGPLTAPSVRIDVPKLLLTTQKARIDKKKKALEKKLIGRLLGEDDKESSANEKENNGNESTGQPKKADQTNEEKPQSTEDKLKKKLLQGLFGDD